MSDSRLHAFERREGTITSQGNIRGRHRRMARRLFETYERGERR